MSHIDKSLDRLLRAAARAPRPDTPPISFATETRTLAAWRAARSNPISAATIFAWRTGLATAFATALLSVGVSFAASRQIDAEVSDPYLISDPGISVAMSTGWLP